MKTELDILEKQDTLGEYRKLFLLPEDVEYFCGHSLGAMPKKSIEHIQTIIHEECGKLLVDGWNEAGWFNFPEKLGDKLAPLIGAQEGEVIVCDSTTINLFKVIGLALKMNPKRKTLLVDKNNFPADLYIIQGITHIDNSITLEYVSPENIIENINENVAAIVMSHVDYRLSTVYDIEAIAKEAKAQGVLTIFDLAHSAGVIPIQLNEIGADFAIGCGYKYLNGGPGAPSYIFVPKKHQGKVNPMIQGWLGHKNPFKFEREYQPCGNIREQLCGTPPILSMKCLEVALQIFETTSIETIRKKSLDLSEYFIDQMSQLCPEMKLLSPRIKENRGSHLAFSHPDAFPIKQAMASFNITADYREPNCIRFGFSPLYNSFSDAYKAINKLSYILKEKIYDQDKFKIKIGNVT